MLVVVVPGQLRCSGRFGWQYVQPTGEWAPKKRVAGSLVTDRYVRTSPLHSAYEEKMIDAFAEEIRTALASRATSEHERRARSPIETHRVIEAGRGPFGRLLRAHRRMRRECRTNRDERHRTSEPRRAVLTTKGRASRSRHS